ncbi:MAG: hypothetical protein JXN60_04865 [Lentisphaerae bacterium]|nr:hypothetical protein [Lentisphaerota bacterium]
MALRMGYRTVLVEFGISGWYDLLGIMSNLKHTLLLFLILPAMSAAADKVVLRIWAANPAKEAKTVQIKSNLPARVREHHILNRAGLDLGYDVRGDVYYVHKDVLLQPKGESGAVVEYRIEIEDIWQISPDKLDELTKHSDELIKKLNGTDSVKDAEAIHQKIKEWIADIRQRQTANSVKPGIDAIQHIKAYDDNLIVLGSVKKCVGDLENMVLGVGQDPGKLIGDIRGAAQPNRDIEISPETYKTAIIRISVKNSSETQAKEIPVSRRLPTEIKANDILDSGELLVRTDPQTGHCYVYKTKVAIPANSTVLFEIKIRDKWDVNEPRIGLLENKANMILEAVSARRAYPSIEAKLKELLLLLVEIGKQEKPTKLDGEYIAFFRRQATRLDEIEQQINRIETVLKPMEKSTKLGFKAKPPSAKSTWMIIYIILGFLALMSLLFFLRWFGKTKSEQMGKDDSQAVSGE